MSNLDKDIVITTNRGSSSSDPTIRFTGGNANVAASVNVSMYADGTLSFEGTAGQLFSISDSLSGTLFSVNDVSGIPSIEVTDSGIVRLAQYNGNVGIGTSTPSCALDVRGRGLFTGIIIDNTITSGSHTGLYSTTTDTYLYGGNVQFALTADVELYVTNGNVTNYGAQTLFAYANVNGTGSIAGGLTPLFSQSLVQAGTITDGLSGLVVYTDVSGGTVDKRYGINIQSQTGSVTGDDYAIYSAVTQPSKLAGNIIATSFMPTGSTVPVNGMYLPATNRISFATNTTQRMTIDSNGNVGIGITAPVSLLNVGGQANVSATTASTSTTTGAIITAGGVGLAGNLNVGGTVNTVSGNVGIGTASATGIVSGNALVLFGNLSFNNSTVYGGAKINAANVGTYSSGNLTLDPTLGNYQFYTNNGAHNVLVASTDCAIDLLVTNGASAGSITFFTTAGQWTIGSSTGDAITTTNGNKFLLSTRKINGVATYIWKALQ